MAKDTTTVVGPEISYELSVLQGPQAGASRTWPAREAASHKLRNLCGDCTGWMRRAEDAVAPIITPMTEGRADELTAGQQLTIATWAALKAAAGI
jgi:hypothetical protein